MGESGRYLNEPCCGHHITGTRLLDWSSFCSLCEALQITLFIIGVAGHSFILFYSFLEIHDPILGFGKSVSWKKDGAVIPPGHKMTYNDALHITSNNFILKVAVPGWALSLTSRLRKVKLAFEELQVCRQQYLTLLILFWWSVCRRICWRWYESVERWLTRWSDMICLPVWLRQTIMN